MKFRRNWLFSAFSVHRRNFKNFRTKTELFLTSNQNLYTLLHIYLSNSYFENHREWIRYDEYSKPGYATSSEVVESLTETACDQSWPSYVKTDEQKRGPSCSPNYPKNLTIFPVTKSRVLLMTSVSPRTKNIPTTYSEQCYYK